MPQDVASQFETHRARVYRWALALCRNHDDALDIVQEVFLRMVRTRPEFPGEPAVVAWLRRVTARIAVDRWRARRPTAAPEPHLLPADDCEEPVEKHEQLERIRTAIGGLSEQQRLTLVCKVCDQMTFREIASELGVAVPTVKTHYLRALQAVRERLGVALAAGRAGT